jgi:hypothetical protein
LLASLPICHECQDLEHRPERATHQTIRSRRSTDGASLFLSWVYVCETHASSAEGRETIRVAWDRDARELEASALELHAEQLDAEETKARILAELNAGKHNQGGQ